MDATPLVSCIIPTRNRPELLSRSINSVLDQTYDNIEIIIVVEPPKEPTHQVLQNFEENYERITTIYQRKAHGPSVARNVGIGEASGKYIAFLDDDDFWKPNKIEIQSPLLQKHSIVSCVPILYTDGQLQQEEWSDKYTNEVSLHDVFSGGICMTSCMMFRAQELDSVGGFSEDIVRDEILDLALKILKEHSTFYVVDENLAVMDLDPDLNHVSGQAIHFDDMFTVYHRHKDIVRHQTARKKYVEIGFQGYKEMRGYNRFKYLLHGLRWDYEMRIFRYFILRIWDKLMRGKVG